MRWTEEQYEKYLEKNQKSSPEPVKKKSSKYNNKKTKIDGNVFDSIKESEYYLELKLRLQANDIAGFCLQPKFILSESISYIADFIVFYSDGKAEVIDVKGMKTDVYKLKKKLFEEKYKMKIIEEV